LSTVVQFARLFQLAGAAPPRHGRGKWLCPECKRSDLSVDPNKQVFHCFHAGCPFQGGVGTLRKRLGLLREWLPREEYLRLRRQRERAREAAERLAHAVKVRRLELLDSLHTLDRLIFEAHDAGPDSPEAWNVLGAAYARHPPILAEIAILESTTTANLVRFLTGDTAARTEAIARVLAHGGLYDKTGKWTELTA